MTGIFITKEQLKKIRDLSEDPLKEMYIRPFLEYYNFKNLMDITETLGNDLIAIMENRMKIPKFEKTKKDKK